VKILFVMRSSVYVRNFESTLRALLERGHRVHVAFMTSKEDFLLGLRGNPIEPLCERYPDLSHGIAPSGDDDHWAVMSRGLRLSADYLRYLEPRYRAAHKLRGRVERNVPLAVQRLLERRGARSAPGRFAIKLGLRLAAQALPFCDEISAFIQEQAPDVMLLTPLVEPGSPQADFVRAAQALGVRTALGVYSWDNLTNKGLIHFPPDLVTVWNDAMRREAIELHGVPARRVVVTGSQAYDHWFEWRPRWSRTEFCQRIGLRPDRPFFLYLCSSKFIAPEETGFVRRWISQLREAAEPRLRDVGVLVRPHPQNALQWRSTGLSDLENASLWPRAGANPVDEDSRNEYFDSIYHSAGVVGINTSALIESAIVDRPVYTILAPEFRATQGGTLHFSHLLHVNGGLLHAAESFDEHAQQLLRALVEPGFQSERNRRFVEGFVRPYGLDEPSTPRLVEAIERLAERPPPRPRGRSFWAALITSRLERLATTNSLRSAKDAPRSARLRERHPTQAERERKQIDVAARGTALAGVVTTGTETDRRGSREEVRAKDQAGVGVVVGANGSGSPDLARTARTVGAVAGEVPDDAAQVDEIYRLYCALRERMLAYRQIPSPFSEGIGEVWEQRLEALVPLLDAPPEQIARLRQHLDPLNLGQAGSRLQARVNDQARRKRQIDLLTRYGGQDLLVPELPLLGGVGLPIDGKLYSEESLLYSRNLLAMRQAGILADIERADQRRIVWQVGAGWGSFAYHFKTLFPHVTYIISDLPEILLFSALYLMTVFSEARFELYDPKRADEGFPSDSAGGPLDFAFLPLNSLDALRPGQLDLTIDLGSFQELPPAVVRAHLRRAHELRTGYVYSYHDAYRSGAERWAESQTLINEYFWPHAAEPFPMGRGVPSRLQRHRYLLGWRRLLLP
jgi:putative sugar O-methyltransferase